MIQGRQFAARQIVGQRAHQEDDFGIYNGLQDDARADDLLLVLADGMGGHAGGALAAGAAVEAFIAAFLDAGGGIVSRLAHGLEHSNAAIAAQVAADPGLAGMGTTLVGAAIEDGGLRWISVGDSPMWLVRGAALRRLNEDHSMAPLIDAQVRRGEITALQGSFGRNMLRSALTGEPLDLVDESPAAVLFETSDRVVIASDGILTLDEDRLIDIAGAPGGDAQTIAENLLDAVEALDHPRQDNTTVIVVVPDAA